MDRKRPGKGIYLLPNMITTMSLFFGFLALVWAMQGQYETSAMSLLLAALMDGLDGKVARLTNTASEFGIQYDSLADLAAFGIAPAVLLWQWQLQHFGRTGIAAAFFYTACGALRLARFNASTAAVGKRFFIGLPIPVAACTVSCFIFFAAHLPAFALAGLPYAVFALAVALGLVMVSSVRYFSFKEYDFLRAHPIRSMLTFIVLLALVISAPKIMGFLLCVTYIAGGLTYTFVILPRRNRQLLRALTPQDS
ncbi:MAG: CDP-diacylglycerol--serine O-phosphatidyltransferase [Desulfovibrio sp.]|jgi:CDP-diacylglycerol--serine O-phosphatidyltransferase|nr:CDP-diacylglycerol--serine O-phosphatidyltransferase [Desulfovibrio sp.]